MMSFVNKYLSWFDFKMFLKYASGNFIFQITTLIAEIYVLKLVDIDEVGVWQYALLLQGYVIISRLGIINSFNRDYPFFKSSNKDEYAEKVLSTTSFHVLLSMSIQSIIFLIIAIYYVVKGSEFNLALTMFVMTAYTIIEAAASFEEAKLRATIKFNKISLAKVLVSIVTLLALIFPYLYGYYGLLVRVLLIQIFLLAYYKLIKTKKIKIILYKKVWLKLFRDGWKLWLWSYLKSFNKSLPKLFLITFSTFSVLGFFTPLNWMLLSLSLFTASLNAYLYPNLSLRFGKGDKNLPRQILIINLIVFCLAIPVIAFVYLLIPYLVELFLPKYVIVIEPMQIALIASLFDIFSLSSTVWVASKDWFRMYLFLGVSLLIRILGLVWLFFNQENILFNTSLTILFTSVLVVVLVILMLLQQENEIKKKTPVLFI
jgi:O-antigen/teichoic acid export membrane protein